MTTDDVRSSAKDIAGATRDAVDTAQGTASDLTAKVSSGLSDAASKVSEAAGDTFGRAKQGAGDLYDKMPNAASDAIGRGQDAYRTGSDRLARQVGKQPIEALLLAGAIGYLVGWAANRG